VKTTGENGDKTILVVEDDKDMNELICAILNEAGYKTISAMSGEKGLERAYQDKPDLVLLDIQLPKMDGIEVCRAITSNDETKSIPVIMVTIKKELSTKLSSYIAGARRFISKPFGVEELVGEIRKTLRQTGIPQHVNDEIFDPRD
jgi:two-component system, OmpR family, alkaline phosphatase synthesis response regulator PhoP